MRIKNINPQGDVQVAAMGFQLVKRGESVEVPEPVAALLLIQTLNWELAEKAPKAEQEFAAKVIAEHLADLAAASRHPEPVAETTETNDTAKDGDLA